MRDYELVIILNPEDGVENMPAAIEKIQQLIKNAGGEISKVDEWG